VWPERSFYARTKVRRSGSRHAQTVWRTVLSRHVVSARVYLLPDGWDVSNVSVTWECSSTAVVLFHISLLFCHSSAWLSWCLFIHSEYFLFVDDDYWVDCTCDRLCFSVFVVSVCHVTTTTFDDLQRDVIVLLGGQHSTQQPSHDSQWLLPSVGAVP